MNDLDSRFRLAGERVEALRAEAARDRMARSAARAGAHGRTSLRATLGHLLIRVGRALGGDGRIREATTVRASSRGSRDEGRTVPEPGREDRSMTAHLSGGQRSGSPRASGTGLFASQMLRSVHRDGLDRLIRDLAAGETPEL